MRYLVILFATLLIGGPNASSQEPSDHQAIAHKEQKSEQKKATPKKEVTPVKKTKPDVGEDAGQKPDAHADEKLSLDRNLVEYTRQLAIYTKELSKYTSDVSGFTFWLVIVTASLAAIGSWQGWQLRQTVKATKNAADAALATAQNMEAAERAYVKMSHHSPGVHLEEGKNWFTVSVEVRNAGRTPARVTDVVLTTRFRPYDEALPIKPEYIFTPREEGPVHAFLVTREHFKHERTFPMRSGHYADARSEAYKLWILGYIDYRDVFGQRHRAGYARLYISSVDDGRQNTLHFVPQKNYNYDRKRKRGEGNDWDEELSSAG